MHLLALSCTGHAVVFAERAIASSFAAALACSPAVLKTPTRCWEIGGKRKCGVPQSSWIVRVDV